MDSFGEYICAHLNVITVIAIFGGTAAVWWYKNGFQRKVKCTIDLNRQTRELSDGSRVAAFLEGDKLKDHIFDDARTLYEGVRRGLRLSQNGPMLGYRKKLADGSEPYAWLTYSEVIDRSVNFANGLVAIGIKPGQDTLIGIYSKNRPEWTISELSIYNGNSVVVPLYDTLGTEALSYVINKCSMNIIICDSEKKANGILKRKEEFPTLRYLIIMDKYDKDLLISSHRIQIFLFDEIEKFGKEISPKPKLQIPKPSDICTVCFTSGTTGIPKGVILTHANVISNTTMYFHLQNFEPNTEDVAISFLPLAHMYERVIECLCFQVGGRIGYFSGEIRRLPNDIMELRPTVFPLVPRVLHRIYDKVQADLNNSILKKKIFNLALNWKIKRLKSGQFPSDSWFDKLVFMKIRRQLGGRVKLVLTGSAPVAEEILEFARATFGCFVLEGYGQTECVAASTGGVEADMTTGHVGVPLVCNAIKLVDVPELGYYSKDEVGEVCIKGFNVFKGYFKNEEATKQTLDSDGWLHTGDVARWNSNGTLKIIDRKKHIFKLQQGEYIAPEKIENVYIRSQFVAQAFVYGEGLKACLVGIIVPDEEVTRRETEERFGIKNASVQELCSNSDVKKMILEDLTKTGKTAGLQSFEQVKDIYLSPEHFTVENDLLTPTLKSKRPNIRQHFAAQIAAMYSVLD